MSDDAFGDSVTVGGHSSDNNATAWIALFGANLSTTFARHANGGDRVTDQAINIFAKSPSAGDRYTLLFLNDEFAGYNPTGNQALSQNAMLASLLRLSIPFGSNHIAAGNLSVGSGSWSSPLTVDVGGVSNNVSGSEIHGAVSGNAVAVFLWWKDGKSGSVEIDIDDEIFGPFSTNPPATVTTPNGATMAPFVLLFTGLPNQSHMVKIKNLANVAIYVSGIAAFDEAQIDGPKIMLGIEPPLGASQGSYFKTRMLVNGCWRYAAALANRLGCNISISDLSQALDAAVDLDTDGIHPLDSGHAKIATEFEAAYAALGGSWPFVSDEWMQRAKMAEIRGLIPKEGSTISWRAGVPVWN